MSRDEAMAARARDAVRERASWPTKAWEDMTDFAAAEVARATETLRADVEQLKASRAKAEEIILAERRTTAALYAERPVSLGIPSLPTGWLEQKSWFTDKPDLRALRDACVDAWAARPSNLHDDGTAENAACRALTAAKAGK